MMVTDLNHFLDLPDDVPGPARRLAEFFGMVVRAATAGDAGIGWVSALPCRRRPGRRPCPGRIVLLRPEPPGAIQWQCDDCDDDGVLSNWEGSPYDLRPRRLTVVRTAHELVVADGVAVALREQRFDAEIERVVFRMRAHHDGALMSATEDELDALVALVATAAATEPRRERRRRLNIAMDSISQARDRGGSADGG